VHPFGNSLVTTALTAVQLKALLEQQFTGCGGQSVDRVLQPSNGFRFAWSASAPACAKIVDATFTPTDVGATPPAVTGATRMIVRNGVVLKPARTYRVTVNNCITTGGDGYSTPAAGTNRLGGAQDIDALVAYLAVYTAPLPPFDPRAPVLGEPRIEQKAFAPTADRAAPRSAAKRLAPPTLPAVTLHGVRYEQAPLVPDDGTRQRTGWLDAYRGTSQAQLWRVRVYALKIDPKLEDDVQDVFFRSRVASPDGREILIENERGERFALDVRTRDVRSVP
jgi:hypothetical protein